jgi:hypothetical protein
MPTEAHRNRACAPASGAERHTQPVTGGIAWGGPGPASCSGIASTVPTEEISMRHALITIHLLNQAGDAATAQAEADARLEHQARTTPRTQPAEPGRFARVVTLVRRVRALAAPTT